MTRSVDYDHVAATYDRRYDEEPHDGVERSLLNFVGGSSAVLEVGCGTGHWLALLDSYGFPVAGLDPSRQMLQRAKSRVPNATLKPAHAEQIPWGDASFDRLVCINTFHHFSGRQQFFSEARRVLRTGGGVMIVGLDPHTGLDRWYIYDYFEKTLEIDKGRYPLTRQIRDLMLASGFCRCETVEAQHIPFGFTGREAMERGQLDKTFTSQLTVLTDEEYERGINRIRQDIEAAEARGEQLDLVADLRLYATVGWAGQ